MRRRGQRDAVRSLNRRDFAEVLAISSIDDHEPVLAGNEHAMVGRIGRDVVPPPVPAQGVRVRDAVLAGGLPLWALHRKDDEAEESENHPPPRIEGPSCFHKSIGLRPPLGLKGSITTCPSPPEAQAAARTYCT